VFSVAIGAVSLLALPGSAAAFQTIRIEGGTLFITGDVGKTPDEVTIRFESATDEYVIGHDIDMLVPPPGCVFEGSGPPFKIMRCSARGITRIRIDLGSDRDRVMFDNVIEKGIAPNFAKAVPYTYLPIDLVSVEVNTGPGNDRFDGANEVVEDDLSVTGTHIAVQHMDMGTGVDSVSVEGGQNTIEMEGSGRLSVAGGNVDAAIAEGGSKIDVLDGVNSITVGPGNSTASIADGINVIAFGPGTSSVEATNGTNTVSFGPGNSVFSGGDGIDSVVFGPGNNRFSGGRNKDEVSLGPGKDSASGGAHIDTLRGGKGRDTLRGGIGGDSLLGGPGFDSLFGGPGRDTCLPGGPGFVFSCEIP
jgi:Ca2+-binding RTX toxin-like protein